MGAGERHLSEEWKMTRAKVEQLKSHKVRPKRVKPLAQRLKEDKDKMDMEE